MIKKFFSLTLSIILTISLTGCWDYRDINKKNILLAVGLDYTDGNYRFVVETAQIRVLGQKERIEQKEHTKLEYGEGIHYAEARRELEHRDSFPIFLGTVRAVIFDEEAAKEGIETYISRMKKIPGYRKTTLIVVSKEKTDKVLSVEPNNDITAGFMVDNIVNNVEKDGRGIYKDVGDIMIDIAFGKIGYVLPYIEVKDERIHYLGAAVMKDSKMIGNISAEQGGFNGLVAILLKHPNVRNVIAYPNDPKNLIYFETKIKNKNIKTDYVDEKVNIDINLKASSKLLFQYYIKPIDDNIKLEIEQMISKQIKESIENIVDRSQNEFQCDILNFGKYFRYQNPKTYRKIDWIKQYPLADINVNVDTKITNLGTTDPNAKGVFEDE